MQALIFYLNAAKNNEDIVNEECNNIKCLLLTIKFKNFFVIVFRDIA